MMTDHTKEPWKLGTSGKQWSYHISMDPRGGWFLEINMGYPKEEMAYPEEAQAEFEANAARVIAAVNFTAGYSTEALEGVTLEEVVAKLTKLVPVAEQYLGCTLHDTRAILAHFTKEGGKP